MSNENNGITLNNISVNLNKGMRPDDLFMAPTNSDKFSRQQNYDDQNKKRDSDDNFKKIEAQVKQITEKILAQGAAQPAPQIQVVVNISNDQDGSRDVATKAVESTKSNAAPVQINVNVSAPPAKAEPAADAASAKPWSFENEGKGKGSIDLGRYDLKLNEGESAWTLIDKDKAVGDAGREMKIWGDPHVNYNNDESKVDVDFKKDLNLTLEDGTNIHVETCPGGKNGTTYSSKLTVSNGEQALEVSGLGGKHDGASNLNISRLTDADAAACKGADDVTVFARDGAWYTKADGGEQVTQDFINKHENGTANTGINLSQIGGVTINVGDFAGLSGLPGADFPGVEINIGDVVGLNGEDENTVRDQEERDRRAELDAKGDEDNPYIQIYKEERDRGSLSFSKKDEAELMKEFRSWVS